MRAQNGILCFSVVQTNYTQLANNYEPTAFGGSLIGYQ